MSDVGTEAHKRARMLGVAAIEAMGREELSALWPSLMGCMLPRGMSQGLLRRFLAFEAQVQGLGGLSRTEIERIDRLADGRAKSATPKLVTGARFLREWNGVTHIVERTEVGYRWNGQVFASLTAVAKEITGAHWSGPRFFGVKADGKAGDRVVRSAKSTKARGPA